MTARKLLSHRALGAKLTKLVKHEQRYRAELARRNGELKKKLDAAEKPNARLNEVEEGNGPGKKRETKKREDSLVAEGARRRMGVQR